MLLKKDEQVQIGSRIKPTRHVQIHILRVLILSTTILRAHPCAENRVERILFQSNQERHQDPNMETDFYQSKLAHKLKDLECEFMRTRILKENCNEILDEQEKQIFVLNLVNCYLEKMNRPDLCETRGNVVDVTECLRGLDSGELLLFTEFYQGFSFSCRYMDFMRKILIQQRAFHELNENMAEIRNEMWEI